MPTVRRNIVANAIGQGWSGLLGIVLIPVYIKLIGIESYGLVGLFVTVQGALAILDFGLAGTINRELARGSQGAISAGQLRDLVRTFEFLYWPIAALIACLSLLFAPVIAERWLTPVDLSPGDVSLALTLMGLVVAAQWPSSLYGGALAGLQQQGLLNMLIVAFSTLRSAGVIVPLLVVEPTATVFFLWQLALSVIQAATFAFVLWRRLPAGPRPRFSADELGRVWRFAGGVAGTAASAFVLQQFDRLILASMLDLKSFGYYSTAAALASAIPRVVQPVASAVYPRYSQLVVVQDNAGLRGLYHRTNQAVAVMLAAVGALFFFYAESILHLWTASTTIAEAAGTVLKLLVMGSVFGGLASLPYSLQLAHGNARLSLWLAIIGVCGYVPVLWVAANGFGAVGAAAASMSLNLALLLAGVHLMHRRMLVGEEGPWYLRDVLPAFIAAFAVGFVLHWLWPDLPRSATGLAMLLAAAALLAVAAFLAARDVRAEGLAVASRFALRRAGSRHR